MARIRPALDPDALAEAADILRSGGLVAMPTETVYGLAANALDPRAVERIFEAKRRPGFDPLIVHLAAADELGRVARMDELPEEARRVAFGCWPGSITVVVPKGDAVSDRVTSGLPDVAVRVPDHPAALALLRAAGVPLAAPSANLFGQLSPTRAEHVADGLGDAVDLILDGGPCTHGVESTVVGFGPRLAPPGHGAVLRHGGLPMEAIIARTGVPLVEGVRVLERPLAPGQLARHYAPRTPLRLLDPNAIPTSPAPDRALLVAAGPGPDHADTTWGVVARLAPGGDLREAAHHLFATLRELDRRGLAGIDVIPCSEDGVGRALVDRLRRAAAR